MRISILLCSLSLAACTTVVTKPGVSQTQIDRDIAECKYEGEKAAPYNALIANDIAKKCLRLRGYRNA